MALRFLVEPPGTLERAPVLGVDAPPDFLNRFVPLVESSNALAGLTLGSKVATDATDASDATVVDLALPSGGARYILTLESSLPDALRVKAHHGIVLADASPKPGLPPGRSWNPPAADGLFFVGDATSAKSLPPLAISTADCLAVAMVARSGPHVGAALVHAGWRGFTGGILHDALDRIVDGLARRDVTPTVALNHLEIVISPAVFGSTYECGTEVESALRTHFAQRVAPRVAPSERANLESLYDQCMRRRSDALEGKIHPDLQLLAVLDLAARGVNPDRVTILRVNTAGHPRLPSYRHATSIGADARARMLSHLLLV
jgi:copper oxidase (laccase) domain-containing protein